MAVARIIADLEIIGAGRFDFPLGMASLGVDEGGVEVVQVAIAASDTAVSLGGVTTATVLALHSDQTLTYKLNGSSDALTLTAGGVAILFNSSITALTVSNASGSEANLTRFVAGA